MRVKIVHTHNAGKKADLGHDCGFLLELTLLFPMSSLVPGSWAPTECSGLLECDGAQFEIRAKFVVDLF